MQYLPDANIVMEYIIYGTNERRLLEPQHK